MSTKTTFKRIALVAVAALGLGVLSVAPAANAGGLDDVLTISASSASITVGESASVTATVTFTSKLTTSGEDPIKADSSIIYVAGTGAGGNIISRPVQDTANTVTANSGKSAIKTGIMTIVAGGKGGVTGGNETITANTAGGSITAKTDSFVAITAGAYTKASYSINFTQVSTVGTYVYTISVRDVGNTALYKTATFTLTVSAGDTTGTAAKSLLWLNDTQTVGAPFTRADSAVVKSAGTSATYLMAGLLIPEFRNAADTTTTATQTYSGDPVTESMTINVSGPGLLTFQAAGGRTSSTTYAKSVTVSLNDTVTIWSDGTAGTATFTAYIGGVALTQAAKTMKFFGKPSTITATLETKVVASSGSANGVVSFVVKDSASNALTSTAIQYNTGTPSGFFLILPDTKVVSGTAVVNTGSAAYVACSTYNAKASRWECNPTILDSGTVSVVIADSYTAATSVATVSAALTITAAGSGYKGSISSDKSSYVVGEKAMITLTQTDYYGRNVVDNTTTSAQFGSPYWASISPTFGDDTSSQAVGGHLPSGTSFTQYLGAASYYGGIDTVSVYMPTTAGTYTLMSIVPGSASASAIWTFTVTDPTRDAADAATDAALEATDAAYAAQDAAQLAAEAADAATAAAEAATAAVEDLATQVASLFADLQKQITTLANVVAKIAKKVKA